MATRLPSIGTYGGFTSFMDELDDWCGTRPPRKFPPRPKALRDVLIATLLAELSSRVSQPKLASQMKQLAGELHAAGAGGLVG